MNINIEQLEAELEQLRAENRNLPNCRNELKK
jgi:hypothetical protein